MRCARVYARQSKHDEAITELKKAAAQAKDFETRPESGVYGSILIGKHVWKRTDYENVDSRPVTQVMADYWMKHEAFNTMRDMPEFIEIINELKNI